MNYFRSTHQIKYPLRVRLAQSLCQLRAFKF